MNPLVSVVVCNYNYGELLPDALASAVGQTYRNLEIVVVDDGSTDNSRGVLAKFEPQIRSVYTKHRGQTMALRTGVKASRGDIVCFLDSDDTWLPTKVEEVVGVYRRHPRVAWVRHKLAVTDSRLLPIGATVPTFKGSQQIAPCPLLYLERVVTAPTSAVSVRKHLASRALDCLEDLARKDEGIGRHLDYDADAYLLALIGASSVEGYSLDSILGYYRRHSQQKFEGREGLLPMMQRQMDVARTVAAIWRSATGRPAVPSQYYKHLVVAETLRGRPKWDVDRLLGLQSGLRIAVGMLAKHRKLAMRQAAAITYAYLAPKIWMRGMLQRHGYREP